MEMQMEILFKNAAFLTSRIFASAMIRVFPSLEHSTGHVRTPKTICRTFVCRTCPRRIVQTWKRHGIRCKHLAGRNAHIFLQRISICIPSEIEGHGLFRILLLSSKGDCLIQVGSPFFFALFYDRRKKESYFFGQVIELDIAGKEAWLWRSSKYSRCI